MSIRTPVPFTGAAIFVLAMTTCFAANAQNRIADRFATVNGIRLHYLIAGRGEPVILLHGYAQNSHMWRPLIPEFAQTRLTVPTLVLTGEKASGDFLIEQARLVDSNVQGVVVKGSGHWLMEEAPSQVIPQLVAFINKSI